MSKCHIVGNLMPRLNYIFLYANPADTKPSLPCEDPERFFSRGGPILSVFFPGFLRGERIQTNTTISGPSLARLLGLQLINYFHAL